MVRTRLWEIEEVRDRLDGYRKMATDTERTVPGYPPVHWDHTAGLAQGTAKKHT